MSQIEELDFSKPKLLLILGRPESGKSNFTKHIIIKNSIKNKIFQFGIVFCSTKYDGDYDFISDKYVFDEYNEEMFEKYLGKLKKMKEKKKDKMPHSFIIFDDMLQQVTANNNRLLEHLYSIHRHLNLTIIFCNQVLKRMSTVLRRIINYAILFNLRDYDTLNSFYQEFGQLFESFEEFKKHFFRTTSQKFTAMIYLSDEQDVNKNYLQIKAPDVSKLDIKLKY